MYEFNERLVAKAYVLARRTMAVGRGEKVRDPELGLNTG
jgi:hypothetical protein